MQYKIFFFTISFMMDKLMQVKLVENAISW